VIATKFGFDLDAPAGQQLLNSRPENIMASIPPVQLPVGPRARQVRRVDHDDAGSRRRLSGDCPEGSSSLPGLRDIAGPGWPSRTRPAGAGPESPECRLTLRRRFAWLLPHCAVARHPAPGSFGAEQAARPRQRGPMRSQLSALATRCKST
jgi:hypothetical protein